MIKWQNRFLGVSKAAALGWARGPGKRSERRSRRKAICPIAMRCFWKVAAFRLTDSIRILSGRRALRCFQNELHHFIILNLKWYYPTRSTQVGFKRVKALGLKVLPDLFAARGHVFEEWLFFRLGEGVRPDGPHCAGSVQSVKVADAEKSPFLRLDPLP